MSFYDHYAKHQPTAFGQKIVQRVATRICREIAAHVPTKQVNILEIGPGAGDLARQFLAEGYTGYAAVEPNDTIRAGLAPLGIPLRNYCIPSLQESDSSQDAIILSHVFEHLNGTTEARTFVAEAARVLRPGGILCVLSPDYLHWGSEFFNGDYTHAHVTTIRRTTQIFEDHGLRPVRSAYFSGPLSGLLATACSLTMRTLLHTVHGEDNASRWYKLKTTFLRSFLVIGKKA